MNISRLLLLSLIPVLSIIHLHAIVPSNNKLDRKQVAEQMKQFHNRMYVYLKCLSGISRCTPEERKIAGQTIRKDIAILASVLASLGFGIFLGKKYGWPRWKEYRYQKLMDTLLAKSQEKDIAIQDLNIAEQEYNRIQSEKPNSPEAHKAYKIYKTKENLTKKIKTESDKYWKKFNIVNLENSINWSKDTLKSNLYEPDPTDTPENIANFASLKSSTIVLQELSEEELKNLKSQK